MQKNKVTLLLASEDPVIRVSVSTKERALLGILDGNSAIFWNHS